MRWNYKLPLRLRSIFHKNRAELDLSEELQFHLQNQIDEYVAQGMNPKEARHTALRSLGGIEQAKEECRDARKVNLIENFLQDARFGLRMLRRSPGFSLLAILCLTLGIGANAAVFSWIEGILFRPYPAVAHQERLVAFVGWGMNFWVPASMEDIFESGGYKLEDRGARWIEAYARLQPGVTFAQAQQEFAAISGRIEAEYPATNRGRAIRFWPLWQTPFNNAATLLPTLEIMLAVVAFVLLIACANVGNLLLVRSFARRHEMSVRVAIGASRSRLWKQLLTEGLVLSLFGATGGLLMAYWCRHALVLLFPARGGVQMHLPGEIDWRVLALSAAVCLATTLLMGLVPALQPGKIDLASSMKMESSGVVGGRGRAWVRSGLVVMQVSLSFVLLVGAGLLLQSLQKIRNTSPGFSTRGVQDTAIDLVSAGYTPARAQTFQDALLERVRSLPGVESAAFAKMTPLSYVSSATAPIVVDGYAPPPQESPTVDYNEVGEDYFVTMGIPLVAGREFTRADDEKGALVAVVNETMAQRFWQGRDPLGQRLQLKGRWMQVVGIAKDSKYSNVRERPTPSFL